MIDEIAFEKAWAKVGRFNSDKDRLLSFIPVYERMKSEQPVAVSLKDIAAKLEKQEHHETMVVEGGCDMCRHWAKLTLDAAGVKYVD